MTSDTTPPITPARPGFGRRLAIVFGRLLKALLKVALVIGLIAGVGYISYLIIQELQRSFSVVNKQVEFNRQKVLEIGHDLGQLENDLAAANAAQDERLAGLESYVQTTLADDLARQDEMLAALDLQLGSLLTQTQVMGSQIAALNDGAVALQGDINENNGRLDTLGGEIDTLTNNTNDLTSQVTELQTAVADLPLEDIEQMRQVVTLFRVWEMVTRARLRLVESNAGLAANDTALALATVEAIIAHENTHPDLQPPLALVQARLTLANANLPANPDLAALDLENAWRELDTVLALLLGVEAVEVPTAEPDSTNASPPAATPTPEPGG